MKEAYLSCAENTKIDLQALLQGHYEEDRLPKDFSPERIVPDFAFNKLNSLGLLYRPVVDESYLATGRPRLIWPEGKSFAVCLTHDVDHVSRYSSRQAARTYARTFITDTSLSRRARGLIGLGWNVAQAIRHANAQDPLHCYERWMDAEAAVGARSTFFFWPGWGNVGKHHSSDCAYELSDRVVFDGQKCTVAEMIREIDHRGWEVGLHPSWYSFNDLGEMKRQKAALEKAMGREIVSVRQHYLHYDIRVTPRIQAEAGLLYDSTLGFNDNIGFRFGTCYPWRLYDLQAKEELPILEVPLIIQDGAMLGQSKGMRLDEETAFQYIVQLTQSVDRVGGVLTLLWHPNYLNDPAWWSLYVRSLAYLKDKNAWFGTVRDIALEVKKVADDSQAV
ncbi:MAG TPA: polysaccharide deacetylase family protein [Paludibacter sp.]|nr:polysaccharide deacetylase family protein [Paludibacter sp.]